jgi:iron-sulfur cluster repair protein YtfE (RIC family)
MNARSGDVVHQHIHLENNILFLLLQAIELEASAD